MPEPSLTQATTLLRCPNCFVALATPQPKFCPECGQETRVRAPKLGEFVQQFGGAYLSTEGAIWRTLGLLLFKPGELTRQYLAGRRKHYVLPLRLYLTVSVLVLLGLRLQTHISIETELGQASKPVAESPAAADSEKAKQGPTHSAASAPSKSADEPALSNAQINLGSGRAGIKDGVFYCENLPGWVCERLNRRIRVNKADMAREMAGVGERVVANICTVAQAVVPGQWQALHRALGVCAARARVLVFDAGRSLYRAALACGSRSHCCTAVHPAGHAPGLWRRVVAATGAFSPVDWALRHYASRHADDFGYGRIGHLTSQLS
jgi:hypothetical protein